MFEKIFDKFMMKYRNKMDKYIVYRKSRWGLAIFLLFLYVKRVLTIGGFYVISYVLGLYLLHLVVQFFTPLGLPDVEDEDDSYLGR